jgi:acyl dehydratase
MSINTRTYESVSLNDTIAALVIPITRTLIVSGAIASRDFQIVHHDSEAARERGSKDIIMNILTTNGLIGRYVSDWAGPDAFIKGVSIRLGAPNYPGDTMTITGTVIATDTQTSTIEISVVGSNSFGNHVTGTVKVRLPQNGLGK